MKRVLVFGMTENPGGVESFLLNYYQHFNKEKLQLDFLCNSYEKVAYEDKLLAMGGRTFHFQARSRNPIRYYRELNRFFKEHAKEYAAIWVNVSSLANIDYLKLAWKYGIPKRIIHSHNSRNMDSRLRGVLHEKNKRCIDKYATDFWACSKEAADWFYREELKEKVIVIHNAIDIKRFGFREEKRQELRAELGLEDAFVIGNIGRMHFQKNQEFILDIFSEVTKKDASARLILVGQGEDLEKLKKKAEDLNLTDKILWPGVRYDIDRWLCAFDLFLFPSRFEGLAIAALEAQANGLPVLTSKGAVSPDTKVNENLKFCALERPAGEWAQCVLNMKEKRPNAAEVIRNFQEKGYDVDMEVVKLEEILCG